MSCILLRHFYSSKAICINCKQGKTYFLLLTSALLNYFKECTKEKKNKAKTHQNCIEFAMYITNQQLKVVDSLTLISDKA